MNKIKSTLFFMSLTIFLLSLNINSKVFASPVKSLNDAKPIYLDKKYKFDKVYRNKAIFEFKDTTNGKKVLIDKNGKVIMDKQYDKIDKISSYSSNILHISKYVVLNDSGKTTIGDDYTFLKYYNAERCYVFQKKIGENYKYGIKDAKGTTIVKPTFDYIGDFKYNKAVVRKKNKLGVINSNGNIVLDLKYKNIKICNDINFAVKTNKKWQIINNNGKILRGEHYDTISDFNKNGLAVATSGNKSFIINSYAVPIYKTKDLKTSLIFVNDLDIVATYKENNIKYVQLNTSNNKQKFDSYYVTNDKNIFIVQKNDKYGITDKNFKPLVAATHDTIVDLGDNRFKVIDKVGNRSKNSLFLSNSKKFFTHDKYDITFFENNDNVAKLIDNNTDLIGVTDDTKVLVDVQYKDITVTKEGIFASNHKSFFKGPRVIKIYDFNGNYKGDLNNNKSMSYTDGIGYLNSYTSNTCKYVDINGNTIIEDNFYSKTDFVDGYAVIFSNGKYGIISLQNIKTLGGVR